MPRWKLRTYGDEQGINSQALRGFAPLSHVGHSFPGFELRQAGARTQAMNQHAPVRMIRSRSASGVIHHSPFFRRGLFARGTLAFLSASSKVDWTLDATVG